MRIRLNPELLWLNLSIPQFMGGRLDGSQEGIILSRFFHSLSHCGGRLMCTGILLGFVRYGILQFVDVDSGGGALECV